MKVKIYPLNKVPSSINILRSPFSIQIAIACATLADGTTTIKNIVKSGAIETTISWCKAIGAKIEMKDNDLVIEGTWQSQNVKLQDRKLKFSTRLFESEKLTTPRLMIPILTTINQPFGIKKNDELIDEMALYDDEFEQLGIHYYDEGNVFRFEGAPSVCENFLVDGDNDLHFMAGLFIALAFIKSEEDKPTILALKEPIRGGKTYKSIIRVLKEFGVIVKRLETNKFRIYPNQKFKSTTITTEMSNLNISMLSLLTKKLEKKKSIKIENYAPLSTQNDSKLFDIVKQNVVSYNSTTHKLKRKDQQFSEVELVVENSLPYLMVLGTLNSSDLLIKNVNLKKERIKRQYVIMSNVFSKLGFEIEVNESNILVHPNKVSKKQQLSCEGDPYVAMSLTILALLSDYPLIIDEAQCVYEVQSNFFKQIEELNENILEYIHN